MNRRIVIIVCMLIMSVGMRGNDFKFKSARIDSLNKDVEDHIYDDDVMSRINLLMKESKAINDQTGMVLAYRQGIFVTSLWQSKPEQAQAMIKDMYNDIKDHKKYQNWFVDAYRFVIYGYQDLGHYHSAINVAKEMVNNIHADKVYTIAHFAIYECYKDMLMHDMEFKELDILIKNIEKGNRYMSAYIYVNAALSYISANNKMDEHKALTYLTKADSIFSANKGKSTITLKDFRENFMWYVFAFYHLEANGGSREKAHFYMRLLKEDGTNDSKRLLYSLRMIEYMNNQQWKEALAACDSLVRIKKLMDISPYNESYYYDMATIYKGLGNYPQALEYMERYKALNDSNIINQAMTNSEEMSQMLNVKHLEYENMQLQNTLKDKKLMSAYTLIALILVVLVLLIVVIVILVKSSRQLRNANKAITEACQNAERALKVKNSFIKSIRHEIRTPLNGIVGFAQVLTSMFDNNEECKQMTDVIIEKSNQLTKIIDDVLYVSDIQNIPLSIEHFKLGDIISETIGNYKPLLSEGGSITASSDIMEIGVVSDRKMLAKVLSMVVDNAVKFAGNSPITITATQDATHEDIVVSDCGPGIPKDKVQWVFDEFTKVDEFVQGTGMGLAICRDVMKRLEGTIFVDTTYDKGCRIVIRLYHQTTI